MIGGGLIVRLILGGGLLAALIGGGSSLVGSLGALTNSSGVGDARNAELVRVVDGDTIVVETRGKERTVRLIGIDTPETKRPRVAVQCGGPEATASLERMLEEADRVRLLADASQDRVDRFGRLLRHVHYEGADLGKAQLRRGWAELYVFDARFRRAGAYERAQARARESGRGAWQLCGGDFHSG